MSERVETIRREWRDGFFRHDLSAEVAVGDLLDHIEQAERALATAEERVLESPLVAGCIEVVAEIVRKHGATSRATAVATVDKIAAERDSARRVLAMTENDLEKTANDLTTASRALAFETERAEGLREAGEMFQRQYREAIAERDTARRALAEAETRIETEIRLHAENVQAWETALAEKDEAFVEMKQKADGLREQRYDLKTALAEKEQAYEVALDTLHETSKAAIRLEDERAALRAALAEAHAALGRFRNGKDPCGCWQDEFDSVTALLTPPASGATG